MPLKDYKCIDCEHVVEYLIRSDADVPTICPECDSRRVEQQINNTGPHRGDMGPCSTPKRGRR